VRALLTGSADSVAPQLLGAILTSDVGDETTSVVITEVEAYTEDDPASHSHRGRTGRNSSMFSAPGTLYVYRSYGIHWCMNISTGPEGEGAAVLLRAGVAVTGRDVMIRRRGRDDHLSDGPGRLCQALAVSGEHDGLDLLSNGPIRLEPGSVLPGVASSRVGISKAADRLWRWQVAGPVTSPRPTPEDE
jgi:DNA-3-methyladenine glycosylase